MHAQFVTMVASFIVTLSTTSELIPMKTFALFPCSDTIFHINMLPVVLISITKFLQLESLYVG